MLIDRRTKNRGFTLVELLVTMAIIAILASIATPLYLGFMAKARRNALLADSRILFNAMLQYNLDQGEFPPCCSLPEEAFDRQSLWPLTRYEFIQNSSSILSKLQNDRIAEYDSPDNPSTNHDFYLVLIHKRDPRIRIVVADTDEYPGFMGQNLHGIYVEKDGQLIVIPVK